MTDIIYDIHVDFFGKLKVFFVFWRNVGRPSYPIYHLGFCEMEAMPSIRRRCQISRLRYSREVLLLLLYYLNISQMPEGNKDLCASQVYAFCMSFQFAETQSVEFMAL